MLQSFPAAGVVAVGVAAACVVLVWLTCCANVAFGSASMPKVVNVRPASMRRAVIVFNRKAIIVLFPPPGFPVFDDFRVVYIAPPDRSVRRIPPRLGGIFDECGHCGGSVLLGFLCCAEIEFGMQLAFSDERIELLNCDSLRLDGRISRNTLNEL